MSMDGRREFAKRYNNLWFGPETYETARLAVGSSIDAMKAVVEGRLVHGLLT